MSITLYLGPMFASKTTALLDKYVDKKTLAIKPILDDRFSAISASAIFTHDGLSIPCITMETHMKFIEHDIPEIVLIDEGQFFTNLAEACGFFAAKGCRVYVAALSGTSECRPWKPVSDLIPICDEIVHCKAKLCNRCRRGKASFTALRPEEGVKKGDILIGGAEKYEPVCRECWDLKNK